MSDSIVVVGAGQAAAQLCMSLRQGGFSGRIVVIGDEPFPPYQRPPLSKKFLSDRPAPDTLFLRPVAFWESQQVELVLGTAVGQIDLHNRAAVLTDGRAMPYRTLALATGTRARQLPVPGNALAGVFSLRAIGDVQGLRGALDDAERVVVIGAGYIGLEVAAVLRAEGRAVTVLEAEDRVLKRVTAPGLSAFFDALHRERGVEIRLGARLAAIVGDHQVRAVQLADGSTLAADLVLLATGAQPNAELAQGAGLACNDGIVVDALARTAAPDVYAIGDCTRFPSRRYGRHLRLESVQNAIDQAKAAAAAILGQEKPYDPVPWFWSDQYDIKLQIAGLHDGHDRAETIGDPATRKLAIEYRRDGRLIAVDSVNDGRAHMLARKRIAQEMDAV
jgi:3-phenylpropionate/trans-cinnamate dioxygenase ferredoxin reductase subunit